MISVDNALKQILRRVFVLEREEKPLLNCMGQCPFEDIYADRDVPNYETSAMDGFAVRAEDIPDAAPKNPVILRVIETITAGDVPRHFIVQGTAARIMTGAPIPPGSDCVVKFEDTDELQSPEISVKHQIGIHKAEKRGGNVLKKGYQINKGFAVAVRGLPLSPPELGLLASLGKTTVSVIRRPFAAVITSGEELVLPGKPISFPHIYNGNSIDIAAQVLTYGGVPKVMGIARDRKSSIIKKLQAASSSDLIITTGGVSGGDHDLIRDAVSEIGEVVFSGVSMAPGKSFTFAMIHSKDEAGNVRKVPHFALAGNPTASMVNFEVLVRPALWKMLGKTDLRNVEVDAYTEETLTARQQFVQYIWVNLRYSEGKYTARSAGSLAEGMLASLNQADGLALVPPGESIQAGGIVKVYPLNWH